MYFFYILHANKCYNYWLAFLWHGESNEYTKHVFGEVRISILLGEKILFSKAVVLKKTLIVIKNDYLLDKNVTSKVSWKGCHPKMCILELLTGNPSKKKKRNKHQNTSLFPILVVNALNTEQGPLKYTANDISLKQFLLKCFESRTS